MPKTHLRGERKPAFRLYLSVWAWRVLRFGAFHLAERLPQNLAPAPRPTEQDIATIRASGHHISLFRIVVRPHIFFIKLVDLSLKLTPDPKQT